MERGSSPDEITQLIKDWSNGDKAAFEKLIPLVYDELRQMAHRFLIGERYNTMQTTSVINEAYIRLVNYQNIQGQHRAQFFALATKVIRHILLDHAKSNERIKRGGDLEKVPFDEAVALPLERSRELIDLDDALKSLEEKDPRKAQIVELLYFGGLTQDEVAEVLGIHPNTVGREWKFAAAWLRKEMSRRDSK
jgi:RNA polymerase sigma-70 factor, ECF subfamily